MSPSKPNSRDRMLLSAIALLRERGATATTVDGVLLHSGAPRGSVYHRFPGGRAQLIDEAVTLAGQFMTGLIDAAGESDDPVAAIDGWFAVWRAQLVDSDFRLGCPIVAVAVAADDDLPSLAGRAGVIFSDWTNAFTSLLARHGVPEDRSRRLANLIVAAEEGAIALCRAQLSLEPIDHVADEVRDLLTDALGRAT